MIPSSGVPGGRRRWPGALAGILVALYILTFTWLAIQRHASFDSGGFDLGVYDQAVWNTLHGRIFFYTTTGQPLLHLSNHADFILLLLAPFYLIHSGPETLLFLQAAAIGLGGLPLFWLGRERLRSDLAGISLLAAYLLLPTLQVAALSDFHPSTLAVGFLMYAFYYLVKQKPVPVLLFAVLAMACKEELPLIVIFMGLYAGARYRNWRLGLATMGLGITWFAVVMNWVIPAYSVTGRHLFLEYYSDLGASPLEVVTTAITRPGKVLEILWQLPRLAYLRDVLVPFALLPLLGLPVLLIGLPAFAINMLSANPAMYDATMGHYGADVAPWLAWGALYGAVYFQQGACHFWRGGQRWVTGAIGVLLLAVALAWQVFYGYSPLALDAPGWQVSPHDRLAQRFMDQIPPDAPLAAQGELYPHLSDRRLAYHLPAVKDAEYVFADVASTTRTIHPNDLQKLVQGLLQSGQFGVQDAADGYLLLRRGLSDRTIPDAFYGFARAPGAQPQHSLQVTFGGSLRLLGFDVLDEPRRQETAVRLYWQALGPIKENLRLYPFFVNGQGEVIEDTQQRPLIAQLWYPPRRWSPGEVIATETLPWPLGPAWSLAVGVLGGANWTDWNQRLRVGEVKADSPLAPRRFEANTWVRLATFERQGRQLAMVAAADQDLEPAHPLQANLGNQLELSGYDLSPDEVQAGQPLAVTLYWRALAPMTLDYTVFVHLIGPDGQRAAQHDGEPWWEVGVPTSTWQPGEVVRDRHALNLPAGLAPGTYRLQVGVYYWQTQQRLPVVAGAAAGDFVELGSVTLP